MNGLGLPASVRARCVRRLAAALLCAALPLAAIAGPAGGGDTVEARRLLMVRELETSLRAAEESAGRVGLDPRVLVAIAETPRHEFVPPSLQRFAYEDRPLPTGLGRVATQPSVTAIMADLAELGPDSRVLLVGVSAGYDAAVLAQLAYRVHIVEMDPDTLAAASERLTRLGYTNHEGRVGDGYYGWPERGLKFDAIVFRWSIDHMPTALLRQLKPGGRLVVPIGPADEEQDLVQVIRRGPGDVRERRVLPVRFAPLPGGQRI